MKTTAPMLPPARSTPLGLTVAASALVLAAGCGSSAGPGSADDDAADAAPQCGTPLDGDTLDRLVTSIAGQNGIRPGESRQLELGVVECCYTLETVAACATWSVREGDPATVDSATGLVHIDERAENGTLVQVLADVEAGRRTVTTDLWVYTERANPLYGIWREVAQFDCATGEQVVPEALINELWFRADGAVWVTWTPFEIYVDWWGDYHYDLAAGTLDITPTGGNYVPGDIEAEGSFEIDAAGRLVLRDMFLGSAMESSAPPACGHVFAR